MALAPYVSYFLVPAIGAEERGSMKHTPKYRDERLRRLEVVNDFLPPPDQLVLRDDGVKITISLSKRSVDFFKRHAARSKVPYLKMIRSLLDTYARQHGAGL
jgi:predicted DNA binding CopG/RHH family protein